MIIIIITFCYVHVSVLRLISIKFKYQNISMSLVVIFNVKHYLCSAKQRTKTKNSKKQHSRKIARKNEVL